MAKINSISNVNGVNNYSTNSVSSASDTESFSSYLGESQSLDTIFDKAAEKYNVPVELLKSIGKTESNFRANAVSRCGAQGIMQLMPATARGLGVNDSFDPEQNIMGGAKYISALLKKYDGNKSFALAAYNAGSGNVAKYGGVPPFEETQNYVKKVLGYMKQGGSDMQSSSSSLTAGNTEGTSDGILHVASAITPTPIRSNYAYLLTNNTDSDTTVSQDLEDLFSFDDYLKFLDTFLGDMGEKETAENTKNISTNDISYNASVLNLL